MAIKVEITKLPVLDSIVIKQSGGHFFISAPNSIIIDRNGILKLIQALIKVGFISFYDLVTLRLEMDKDGILEP